MAEDTENKNIELNLDFEKIVPWNGQQDTGRDVRMKLDRNWQKVVDAFNFLLKGDYLNDLYLRKDKDDRSVGYIASDKGIEVGKFQQGELGSGGILKIDEEGNSYLEVDKALFRKIAYFVEIMIKKLSHVGGSIILSPASMKCSKVEEYGNYYRCYFDNTNGGRTINQEFSLGDQARSQTFNIKEGLSPNVSNQYYWRLVVGIGDNYIDLSKTDCDSGSGIPQAGDEIVLCGNRNNPGRQNALILSSYGEGTPSLIMYKGIKSYSLADAKKTTRLSPELNELTGIVNIEAGSTGASNLEDFPDEVFKAIHVGAVNLLLNSGFTGDYKTEDLNTSYTLNSGYELFSKGMKHWTGTATITDDIGSVSGKSAVIGSLSQSVQLMKSEGYVVSFRAKGTNVKIMLGGDSVGQELTSEYIRYSFKFISDGVGSFAISGDATICDLQLERGTIATDWNPSPYDNDKTLAEFQAIKYIQDAIREGDTSIIGGLILSSMIQLGNYKDGKMEKVNAGISGIYNDDNDVAFWGGGTLEQAIKTVMKFKENPNYHPSDTEWNDLANFVVSHGGDLFLRGYIYALGGYFKGEINAESGVFKNVKSPNGNFQIDDKGRVYISGRFETSKGNQRILINPDDNSIVMSVFIGRKEFDVVKLHYETEAGYLDFGNLSLTRLQNAVDEYGNEVAITTDIISISPSGVSVSGVGRPTLNITNEAVNVTKGDAYVRVGLTPKYDGLNIIQVSRWVADISSNVWPTRQDAEQGGVYVEWQNDPDTYETTEGILKIKV